MKRLLLLVVVMAVMSGMAQVTPPALPLHGVTITWTASSGPVDGYIMWRSSTTGGPYAPVTRVTGTSATDLNVTANSTYYYVLTAFNARGNSAFSNEVKVTIPPDPVPPATPTINNPAGTQ